MHLIWKLKKAQNCLLHFRVNTAGKVKLCSSVCVQRDWLHSLSLPQKSSDFLEKIYSRRTMSELFGLRLNWKPLWIKTQAAVFFASRTAICWLAWRFEGGNCRPWLATADVAVVYAADVPGSTGRYFWHEISFYYLPWLDLARSTKKRKVVTFGRVLALTHTDTWRIPEILT